MDKEKAYKAHVVVLPLYGQSHINPMIQFSKRLASKGIKITVTTSLSSTKSMMQSAAGSIIFKSIYDDCSEGGMEGPGGLKGFLERYEASGSQTLTEIIRKHESSDHPVKCLIYDGNLPWGLNLAKKLGISGAAFFTQSCAYVADYYVTNCELSGDSGLPLPLPMPVLSLKSLPKWGIPNLPALGPDDGRFAPIIQYILSHFTNIEKADWILFNSFDKLEEEVVKWMSNILPIRTIGPTVPSIYLDERMGNDSDYDFSLYKSDDASCMKWLNTKEIGSVVYVSFGSSAILRTDQISEVAKALRKISNNFLWVVRETEQIKLPPNFVEETSEKGLVVTWCCQLEVLAHPSVGCFVSHCGWNSTVEAISFGVPIVALPQYLDQLTNAHFVEEVWGVGVKSNEDEEGLNSSEEISSCIKEVMNGERRQEIKKNAIHWKGLAKEAIDEGGSSDKYINEIISWLVDK